MIASNQALENLKREIEKDKRDLEVTEKDLRRRQMGLVDMKIKFDKEFNKELASVNDLKDIVGRFKSQMSRHQIELAQMQADLAKFLKK